VGKTRLAEELVQEASACLIAEAVAPSRLESFYRDPPGNAWAVELEFLDQRARLLRANSPRWSEPCRLWVSDFWFPQGLAYASVWLPPERLDAYRARWEAARRTVVEPKLTVLLDAPPHRLLDRVCRRGRPGEQRLTETLLERLRLAIQSQAAQPGQGPVLGLGEEDPGRILAEVSAAVEAMQ
jgi:deoxyadenosine/deoxycytidine kinase